MNSKTTLKETKSFPLNLRRAMVKRKDRMKFPHKNT